MKKLFFFIFFILFSFELNAKIEPPFRNIIELKKPKDYGEIIFYDIDGKTVNLKDYKSKIYILNFWATWCLPCKKEMPSLDRLQNIKEVEIFPINIDYKDKYKSKIFFKDLKIENLSIYFDTNSDLANLFNLRGIPTTIILNKQKEEIVRILGEVDFSDKKFINWFKEINNINF